MSRARAPQEARKRTLARVLLQEMIAALALEGSVAPSGTATAIVAAVGEMWGKKVSDRAPL